MQGLSHGSNTTSKIDEHMHLTCYEGAFAHVSPGIILMWFKIHARVSMTQQIDAEMPHLTLAALQRTVDSIEDDPALQQMQGLPELQLLMLVAMARLEKRAQGVTSFQGEASIMSASSIVTIRHEYPCEDAWLSTARRNFLAVELLT